MPTIEEVHGGEDAATLVGFLASHDEAVVGKAVDAVLGLSGGAEGVAALRSTGTVVQSLLEVRAHSLHAISRSLYSY